MRKLWHTVTAIALVLIVIGIFGVGVGFFMGSSPVALQNHGSINEYLERLQINRDILIQGVTSFLAGFGIVL